MMGGEKNFKGREGGWNSEHAARCRELGVSSGTKLPGVLGARGGEKHLSQRKAIRNSKGGRGEDN